MSFEPQFSIYFLVAWLVGLIPCGLFVFAVANYSRSPKAAAMVMMGCSFLLFNFFGSLIFNLFVSRYLPANTFLEYATAFNCIANLAQGIGVVLIALAAFVDREARLAGQTHGTAGPPMPEASNPYRTPAKHSAE